MAGTKKRKRDDEAISQQGAAEDDLLAVLDAYHQREKHCREDRVDNIVPLALAAIPTVDDTGGPCDERTAAQVFLSLWQQQYLRCLGRAPRRKVCVKSSVRIQGSEEETDLLRYLDVERRRELDRLRQRRWRARQTERPLGVPVAERCETEDDSTEKLKSGRAGAASTKHMKREQLRQQNRTRAERFSEHKRQTRVDGDENWIMFDNELSADERAKCLTGLRSALGAECLDECVCAVCDRLVLRHESRRIDDNDWQYMDKMKKTLKVLSKHKLPVDLVDQYRPPPHLLELQNIMVSPRGIHCYKDESDTPRAWFSVCGKCDKSIEQSTLPKFSIANGFFVGRLEKDLRGLTLPERFMTQLVSIVAITRVMRGGRHRCIRSHCIVFDCTPGPPVLLLPRSIDDVASYRVVMVGKFTTSQTTKLRKMHRVRNQKVRGVFKFYKENNHLYANVTPNESVLESEYLQSAVESSFVVRVEDNTREFDEHMNKEQENIRGESDAWRVMNEQDESNVIERRMGLADISAPVMAREHPVTSKLGDHHEREFEIRRSDKFASDASGDLYARMFPHLFPFGRGHPGEARQINVSLHECVKHYIMLSERQFAEDELFSLVAFDHIALRNMYIHNHFRCQRFPHLVDGYESLTGDQLGRVILENERRRQGCLPWRPQGDDVAHRFLKTVEIGSRSLWGSNAERSQCRHKAFAYQTRFGQPALFVTLTPNTDNSLVLAHYAGISSVETLFDLAKSRLPGMAELREASLGNDCASTRLFMRQVDAFIRYALGIDPATKKRLHFRGLLGDVKAYFGMVETQGRGTLHIHLLIWLNHCPPNSTAVERMLKSSDGIFFRERVASYTRSIVTNELPIAIDECGCLKCGAPFSDFVALPIPESARKDPATHIRGMRTKTKVTEPALIRCGACNTKFSSQHLLRTALLRFRPKQWPAWERSLCASEVKHQVSTEMICRNTIQEALDIVDDRETSHASLRGGDEYGGLELELLQQTNCAQMTLCKKNDDHFRNDELARVFEVTPPSVSDERMAQSSIDYMVAALAVRLNQHLWNHTNSCFKQSKATPHETFCRYRFPRDRVENTSFEASGVEMRRTLGHEYINGFNYEIMATFRCNHDIQVLLGGSDVADRIHYCCKYVTKHQKQLDSQVAVAVAALNRRQEREKVESATLGKQTHHKLARKRVAALMYNMTNRQEIAGPLAALYLYRGSCCYSSATCTTLPLGDVIRQLTTTDEYSCALVSASDDIESSKYHAVSYLDDYVYRPKSLQNVNLYMFRMWYFRKVNERATSSKLRFLEDHPLNETHSLGKRNEDVVPVIQGFRMPSSQTDSLSRSVYKRAVLSLVLFKPFRTLDDLIGSSDCADEELWLKTYEVWVKTRSKFVETIMDNMQDYYSGLHKAEAQSKATAEAASDHRGSLESDGGGSSSSDDCDDILRDDDCFDVPEELEVDENVIDMWEGEENGSVILDSLSLDPASCPTSAAPDIKIARILDIFKKHGILYHAAEELSSWTSVEQHLDELPPIDVIKQWVRDIKTDNTLAPRMAPAVTARDTQVIELLDDSLLDRNMAWKPSSCLQHSPHLRKSFASISETSRVYTLNERQHYALKAIGQALLSRWKQAETSSYAGADLESALRDGQLLFFLGGEGGTGKSRIIDAVQALCESWGRPDSIIKTALTGKAATLISGRTLASFLLQIRKERATEAIMNLELIIIDEVSMMRKYQLAQLDKRLRVSKRVPGVVFGGVHVVLVGDFLQLPPVGGSPLFHDPTKKTRKANVSAGEIAGYQLWQLFVDVIMLKESVRFSKDPEWGRGCQQARLGVWTPDFVAMINSRVLRKETEVMETLVSRKNASTFVTPDNMTRVFINNLYISTAAALLPTDEYPVRVIANFKGVLRALNRSEVRMVMALPDTKFGRMAPYLDLIVGMPIQVTQNVRAEKMVANGTLGRLEAIVYQPGTTFRLVHDSTANMTVKVPSIPPPVVLVRIDRGPSASAMRGCGDANIFPLLFDAEPYNPCEIALPGLIGGVPRSLHLKIQQFPLVCAVASTAYKVQGETLDAMVVTEWRSECAFANKKEQPYLLVSRVTTREAFTTLQPLTSEIVAWAHPSQAALAEEDRLELLSCDTIRRLRNPIDSTR